MKIETALLFEIAIFLSINVGVSLMLRAIQALSPDSLPKSIWFYLLLVATILALNLYRAYKTPTTRTLYIGIAILNVLTTVAVGNTSLLTSVGTLYLAISSIL